jgi:hypothetical protein
VLPRREHDAIQHANGEGLRSLVPAQGGDAGGASIPQPDI